MEESKAVKKDKWIVVQHPTTKAVISARWHNFQITELYVERESESLIGCIYVGRVRNIVKNINAAFIEYQKDCFGYLDLRNIPKDAKIVEGQTVIVMYERDPVKTKDPVLTMNLQLSGRYCIALHDPSGICISTKIKEEAYRTHIKELFPRDASVIIRTNAYEEASDEVLLAEYQALHEKLQQICTYGANSEAFRILYQPSGEFARKVRDLNFAAIDAILTDEEAIYQLLTEELKPYGQETQSKLIYAKQEIGDYLSLEGKFGIFKELRKLQDRIVNLNSGAYLVIDYTEAMTVIDINTGKAIGKKKPEGDEVFLKINTEAGIEVMRQIRMRNLSGMILVDFIDMKEEESNRTLMNLLRKEALKDPIHTTVVDMTKLGIVEITRKRVTKPLHEMI